MLPLDSKSSSITDDDDSENCIEEEDEYPEENAEAFIAESGTLVCRRSFRLENDMHISIVNNIQKLRQIVKQMAKWV